MGKWLQQRVFSERIKEYCRKHGLLTQRGAVQTDVIADIFNIHEDTLRQFLFDSSRKRPHLSTLTRIASTIGVSVAEFLDDPGASIPPAMGIPQEKWAELSEKERGITSAILALIVTNDLSVAEKEELYKFIIEAKERIIRLRGVWADSNSRGG